MRVSTAAAGLALLTSTLLMPMGASGSELPPADEGPGRLVLVLDSSGSMKEPAAGGGTKIAAAKEALGEVVEQLPDDAEVGVRVFGATVFSRSEPGACSDTQNVVPVGPLDREALIRAVADYRPFGETPIGSALQGAAKDLGDEGPRTIVLLSDGEPTCDPDPCAVARRLHRDGVEVRINVVGLDVSGEARSALQCVARAGGGTYYDASSADDLVNRLVKVSVRDLRGFRLDGERVSGSPTLEDALPLEAGTYVDTSLPDEGTRHYLVDKPPGGGVSVSALVRPPDGEENWHIVNRVELLTPEGETCESTLDQSFQVIGLTPLSSAGTEFNEFANGPNDEECRQADRLVATVTLDNLADYRLQVGSYPSIENASALPPPVQDDDGPWVRAVRVPRSGPTTAVAGGVTPDDAPELAPGTTYTDTLLSSEQLVYKIPVEHGQAVRLTARLEPDRAADDVLGVQGNPVTFFPITALGQRTAQAYDSGQGLTGGGFYNGAEAHTVTAVVPPVRVRNVESSSSDLAANGHDGHVYAVLGMGLLDNDRPDDFAAPVTLRAEVVGEPEGAPEYAGEVAGGPSAGASGSASSTTEATAPAGEASDGDARAAADEDAGVGGVPLLAVVGGLALAVAAVAGGLLARRRRA